MNEYQAKKIKYDRESAIASLRERLSIDGSAMNFPINLHLEEFHFNITSCDDALDSLILAGDIHIRRELLPSLVSSIIDISSSIYDLSKHQSGEEDSLDYRSIATLTRSLMEQRVIFHYLCIESCEKEVWEARLNCVKLHELHSYVAYRKSYDPEGSVLKTESDIDGMIDELVKKLDSNQFFQKHRNRKQVLNGNELFLLKLDTMAENSGFLITQYQTYQQILSHYVHSSPLVISRSYLESEVWPYGARLCGLCLDIATSILSKTIIDLQVITDEINDLPRTCSDNTGLELRGGI